MNNETSDVEEIIGIPNLPIIDWNQLSSLEVPTHSLTHAYSLTHSLTHSRS